MGEEILVNNSAKLIADQSQVVSQIIDTDDPDQLEDLTNLFVANQKKKNMARINKLSSLLELVDDEVIMRFTSTPENFNEDQLLKYMDVVQKSVTQLEQNINQTPIIQINNQKNQINIGDYGLDQESRKRVVDAVLNIINGNSDIIDIDTQEEENET